MPFSVEMISPLRPVIAATRPSWPTRLASTHAFWNWSLSTTLVVAWSIRLFAPAAIGAARIWARSGRVSSASDLTSTSSATFALMRLDTAAWTVGSLASGSTVCT